MSTLLPAGIDPANLMALCWFLALWVGYSIFARRMARRTHCLASILHLYRKEWMTRLLQREMRIADASLIGNLERNVNFFASTSLLVIAGVLTVLTTSEGAFTVLSHLPFAVAATPQQLQIKLLVLTVIFVYAFFQFTWSIRQYGFCSVLIGAAPAPEDTSVSAHEREQFATYAAKVIDKAGHDFNYGLRAYYFALAVLGWLINYWVFMLACAVVVAVLYHREFHSKTLRALLASHNLAEYR